MERELKLEVSSVVLLFKESPEIEQFYGGAGEAGASR